jgi:hypothetical protein
MMLKPFPFEIVVDPHAPKDSIYFLNLKYKMVQVGTGEPPRWKEVIDWEATAKASAVMSNISTNQGE